MTSPGKKAKRERERLDWNRMMQVLREQGASCSNCKHFGSVFGIDGPICELHSDWDGFVRAKPDGLCTGWGVTPTDTASHGGEGR